MNEKSLYKLTYGLFLLTASENGKDNGCIINTAIQVANSPTQICISVNKGNLTHDMILHTKTFLYLRLLSKRHQTKAGGHISENFMDLYRLWVCA